MERVLIFDFFSYILFYTIILLLMKIFLKKSKKLLLFLFYLYVKLHAFKLNIILYFLCLRPLNLSIVLVSFVVFRGKFVYILKCSFSVKVCAVWNGIITPDIILRGRSKGKSQDMTNKFLQIAFVRQLDFLKFIFAFFFFLQIAFVEWIILFLTIIDGFSDNFYCH